MLKETKKTKIICTIGPASESDTMINKLIRAGMNVARLNFSHGTHEEHALKIATIKAEREKLDKHVGILLDTKGPEIRTHDFKGGQATLTKNDIIEVHMKKILGSNERFSVTYKGLYDDADLNSIILVDDGKVALKVIGKEAHQVLRCKVLNNGDIKDKRGINVPNVRLNMPFVSKRDKEDILFGCSQDIDFIAASFTRRAQDVLDIKKILKSAGYEHIKIIAKIENQEGVDNMDEIIEASDGIMIARGDLGVEVEKEEVPIIQKEIIKKCMAQSKISITATQMLESMQENPRPTRAEVSDVANAILDGTDAIMLSGESAIGKYPVDAVKTMQSIAVRMEQAMDYPEFLTFGIQTAPRQIDDAIAASVAEIALDFDVDVIVVFTVSGSTARRVSRLKPKVPIIAATLNDRVARGLALNWGVTPILTDVIESFEVEAVSRAIDIAKSQGYKTDAKMILTGGTAQKVGSTSFMRIEKIK